MTPFQATELVNRNNVNNRLSEANSKFDNIDTSLSTLNGKFPVSIANGGTGGTDKSSAVVGLGISEEGETGYGGADADAFIRTIKSHFEYYNAKYVPRVFNARWINNGHGVAVGVKTVENLSEFLLLFNEAFGPKFYVKNTDTSSNWVDYSPTGTVLYENSSGTAGTVTLSDSVANYKKIIIHYRDNNGYYKALTVDDPDGKSISMEVLWHRIGNSTLYFKVEQALITGSSIEIAGNKGQTRVGNNTSTVENGSEVIYIWKVVGYKY